jgi:predicted dehydrogenase
MRKLWRPCGTYYIFMSLADKFMLSQFKQVTGLQEKIKYGMVGGGEGAFIGAVHRNAAQLDSEYQLVCGAFSSNVQRCRQSGEALGVPEQRCYSDYASMFKQEAALPIDQRMQCVAIVTPNHLHFPVAVMALQHGFHVLSDKPATVSLDECQQLANMLKDTGLLYGLTHPYTSYPIVREARERIAAGELGNIRKIIVEYTQGWLSEPIEHSGNPQAAWRLDPDRAGASCCMGDIGVHAFNLAEFVTGLEVSDLSAELNSIVPDRTLDDDGTVLLKYSNGARGVLIASQICLGDENRLLLRVYGDKASLEWSQEEPNSLWLKFADKPKQLLRTGNAYLGQTAMNHTRVPAGHPEGYIEAFANIYRNFADQIRSYEQGKSIDNSVPGIQDALRGMEFIETVIDSASTASAWRTMKRTSNKEG